MQEAEVERMQSLFATAMTADAFTAWLEKQPLDHAFNSCNAGKCPIAVYLAEVFQQKHVGVGFRTAHVNLIVFGLPQWTQDFISRFDAQFSCSGVTVAAVLRLMKPQEATAYGAN